LLTQSWILWIVPFGPEAEARFHSNTNVTPVGVQG
jgi:hypothetical protein